MTDSDLDIDPTLDAHLRRTLRKVAATVDAGAPDDPNVVRLVPTPPPSRPRHWRWIAAAAVTGLASGAAIMAVANRSDAPAASPTASTISESAGVLARACVNSNIDGSPAPLYIPDPSSSEVVLFTTAEGGGSVLVTDANAFALCEGDSYPSGWGAYGPLNVSPPRGDDVVVVSWSSQNAEGDGSVQVLGRVGPDVDAVVLQLPDNEVTGVVQSGWFLVDADGLTEITGLADGGSWRLSWDSADGVERSGRLDTLDVPNAIELCAADADCLATQLDALRSQTSFAGNRAQFDILDDLVVTDSERMAATEAFAECVNVSPIDVTVVVRADASFTVSGASLEPTADDYLAQVGLQETCRDQHMDLVDQAWNLLDAVRLTRFDGRVGYAARRSPCRLNIASYSTGEL